MDQEAPGPGEALEPTSWPRSCSEMRWFEELALQTPAPEGS